MHSMFQTKSGARQEQDFANLHSVGVGKSMSSAGFFKYVQHTWALFVNAHFHISSGRGEEVDIPNCGRTFRTCLKGSLDIL